MKAKTYFNLVVILTLVFSLFSSTNVNAQEKSKKQLKEERKIQKQKEIEQLVNSKEFVFDAKTVIPQGARTVQLTTDYDVEFHPELIKSYLPFFGRGYGGIGYGGDNGMTFEGKPENYSIEKTKKSYFIKTVVKAENETYSLALTVYFDGNSNLTINSNNRSSISYSGEISVIEKK